MSSKSRAQLCHSYLHFSCKYNTLVGLPFFVNRDFCSNPHLGTAAAATLLSYLYQYISEIWVFVGFASAIVALSVVWNDVNVLFGCVSSTAHTAQLVFKIVLLNMRKNQFLLHLKKFDSILKRNELLRFHDEVPSFLKFTSDRLRYIRLLESVVMAVIVVWTSLYFLPFAYDSIVHYDSVDQQNIPIVGFIPFNYSVTPRFQAVIFFQSVLFYFINCKTVAIDYFVLGFIALHIIHFRYLNVTLRHMTHALVENLSRGTDEKMILRINARLQIWLKQHQDTISVARTSKHLLSCYFLIEFGYIVIHTCVPAFVITSTLSWNLNQKIVLIFMCSIGIITLYLLSLSGDVLSESSEEYGLTFYGPHLFYKKSYRITYRMLSFMGQYKCNALGFSNVYPLCSVTFGAILRSVMSYYLALNQIKGLES